jgi:Flp pilus assembly pilin Flp
MRERLRNRRRERGAVALEYILICALLVLALAGVIPLAMERFAVAYRVISVVVCSPFPAGM